MTSKKPESPKPAQKQAETKTEAPKQQTPTKTEAPKKQTKKETPKQTEKNWTRSSCP